MTPALVRDYQNALRRIISPVPVVGEGVGMTEPCRPQDTRCSLAEAARGGVPGSVVWVAESSTLLREIVVSRHWQTPRAFRVQFLRAARELADRDGDRAFAVLDVSERQFRRWLGGAMPRPDACRVLEYMFGRPVAELMGHAGAVPAAVDSSTPIAPVMVVRNAGEPIRVKIQAGSVTVLIEAATDEVEDPIRVLAAGDASSSGARIYSISDRRAR